MKREALENPPDAELIGSLRLLCDEFANGHIHAIAIATVTRENGELVPGNLHFACPKAFYTLMASIEMVQDQVKADIYVSSEAGPAIELYLTDE
jgi:hypothetical protein